MAVLGSTKITDLSLLNGVIGNLNPVNNNSYSLGTSSLKWSNIYATTFTGALSGNASTANKVNHKLTIGSYQFDGSADVTIPTYNGSVS